jgi:hypothetical protein
MTRLINENDAKVVQEVTDPVLVKRGSTEKSSKH